MAEEYVLRTGVWVGWTLVDGIGRTWYGLASPEHHTACKGLDISSCCCRTCVLLHATGEVLRPTGPARTGGRQDVPRRGGHPGGGAAAARDHHGGGGAAAAGGARAGAWGMGTGLDGYGAVRCRAAVPAPVHGGSRAFTLRGRRDAGGASAASCHTPSPHPLHRRVQASMQCVAYPTPALAMSPGRLVAMPASPRAPTRTTGPAAATPCSQYTCTAAPAPPPETPTTTPTRPPLGPPPPPAAVTAATTAAATAALTSTTWRRRCRRRRRCPPSCTWLTWRAARVWGGRARWGLRPRRVTPSTCRS